MSISCRATAAAILAAAVCLFLNPFLAIGEDNGASKESQPAPRGLEGDGPATALPEGARARLGSLAFVQPESIRQISFHPDGRAFSTIAWRGGDSVESVVVRTWDSASGRQKAVHSVKTWFGRAFSSDSRLALTPTDFDIKNLNQPGEERYQGVELIEVATGKRLGQFGMIRGRIGHLALSSDGKVGFVTSYHDVKPLTTIDSYDTATGRKLGTLLEVKEAWNWFTPLALSANGKVLGAYQRNDIYLFDTVSGKELARLKAPVEKYQYYHAGKNQEFTSEVNSISLSPNGGFLVYTESAYKAVHVVDVPTGKELHRLSGGFVSPAFSADEKCLAALGFTPRRGEWSPPRSHAIHVWELATGKEVAHFAKDGMYRVLSFAPDGRTLFGGSFDGKISRWEWAIGKLLPTEGGTCDRCACPFLFAGRKDAGNDW